MKVLNLQCNHQHDFEGWFASEDDFKTQRSQCLIECPICGDSQISKMPSAPRLNLLTSRTSSVVQDAPNNQPQEADVLSAAVTSAAMPAAMQEAWLRMVQHVMAHTEDVGARFVEEARKMHYGEVQERGIRGYVSSEETQALLEEGIGVMPLPLPAAIKGSVH
ncbi:MAG: DUF1178 family protein [Betaproteobacteria bacterium]|nr:DUF1178 family protein [Betaproteobacteria bacterium]